MKSGPSVYSQIMQVKTLCIRDAFGDPSFSICCINFLLQLGVCGWILDEEIDDRPKRDCSCITSRKPEIESGFEPQMNFVDEFEGLTNYCSDDLSYPGLA